MRTFVLLLAISATVLTTGRLITTKAKMEGMTPVSKKLNDAPRDFYGNLFQDGYIPICREKEMLFTTVGKDGSLSAMCYPIVKDTDECPAAPSSTNITPEKEYFGNGFLRCALRCDKPESTCPTGSICNSRVIKNFAIDGYCVYKQPKSVHKTDPTKAVDKYEDGYSEIGAKPKCSVGEVFSEDTIDKVTYGQCHPIVKAMEACSATPLGIDAYARSFNPVSEGTKECHLSCDGKQNNLCPLGSQCITFNTGYEQDNINFSQCYYLKSPSHCNFEEPDAKDFLPALCLGDGEDAVQFTTTDGTEASICAPEAPHDIQCPLYKTPKNPRRVSLAVKDESGTHCQLPCVLDTDCDGGSKCLTINHDDKDTKICLYNHPKIVHYEKPAFEKSGKECQSDEDYSSMERHGTFGACYPTVNQSDTCPDAPEEFKGKPQQGEKSSDGKKFRCELPCNTFGSKTECVNGSVCTKNTNENDKLVCMFQKI